MQVRKFASTCMAAIYQHGPENNASYADSRAVPARSRYNSYIRSYVHMLQTCMALLTSSQCGQPGVPTSSLNFHHQEQVQCSLPRCVNHWGPLLLGFPLSNSGFRSSQIVHEITYSHNTHFSSGGASRALQQRYDAITVTLCHLW